MKHFKIPESVSDWEKESKTLRLKLTQMLGIPENFSPMESQKRGEIEFPNYILRKFIIKSEDNSWIPVNLYMPKSVKEPVPAIVIDESDSSVNAPTNVATASAIPSAPPPDPPLLSVSIAVAVLLPFR